MCQSRQFVVTPEEKNVFSKNDKKRKLSQSQQFARGGGGGGGGGGGYLDQSLLGMCRWSLRTPTP